MQTIKSIVKEKQTQFLSQKTIILYSYAMCKEAVLIGNSSVSLSTMRNCIFTICEYFLMSASCLIISLLKTATALL